MLLKPIGNIFIDKERILKECTPEAGTYEGAGDILSRPNLPGSNYTSLNSHSIFFDDDIVRPLVDMDKLWEITDADPTAPSRLIMYVQMPGCFTPLHVDWMQTYNKRLEGEEIRRRGRWWLSVNDYITGQAIMHEEYVIAHMKSGDVFSLDYKGEHCGVNASLDYRYYVTFSALTK